MKCSLNVNSLRDISVLTSQLLAKALTSRWDVNMLKTNFNELIKTIVDLYQINDADAINLIVSIMSLQIARRKRVVAIDPNYLSDKNLFNLLDETRLGVQRINSTDTSIDNIDPQKKSQVSTAFLDQAYGNATNVRNIICKQTDVNLFDCLFINRGSVNTKLGIVKTNEDLNTNIREYQNLLLQRIIDYLLPIFGKKVPANIKDIFSDPKMYRGNKYTKALEILTPYINIYLKSLQGQTDLLRQLFKDRKKDPESKRKLDAFNAFVILSNFDNYLLNAFGKSIQIKDFGLFTGENKYNIAAQTANVYTTWRTNDNIDITKEVDKITQIAINTTPLLNWNNDTPIDGGYLRFLDFLHIISKIKDLVYLEDATSIVFDDSFELDRSNIWDTLSEDTQKYLKGKSLRRAINLLRNNPRAYLSTIFELLANNNFKEAYPLIYKNFLRDELNKLYSISLGIFNGNNSLQSLTDAQSNSDFYVYITQTADSIFNVNYLQYYRDENNKIVLRSLVDLSVNNTKRKVEQTINLLNSYRIISNWDNYAKLYNFQERLNADKTLVSAIAFNIPNTSIKVTVNSIGRVQMTKNGFGINYSESYEELKPFIDNILKLNLTDNISLEEALIDSLLNDMARSLAFFAARVVFNQYINLKYLLNGSNDSKLIIIDSIYGKKAPNWNYTLDELGLVSPLDIYLLRKIAVAKSNLAGLLTSTQVKDSEGNNLSRLTLSRLLGSYTSLYDLQERLPNSISNHFILLNTPGLLEGVYTVKEYAGDNDKSKEITKMSIKEMAFSLFIFDYIGGLMPLTEESLIGDGYILLLPSVNSDKNTIGRLRLNLNKKVPINGVEKAFKDLNTQELESIIDHEFGEFYEKMIFKVLKDWQLVQSFINIEGMPKLDQDYLNNFQAFNAWYNANKERLGLPKKATDFIKNKVLEYNKSHRLSPLELTDLVHYKSDRDGNLHINEAIVAQVVRFKPNSILFTDKSWLLAKYPSKDHFWRTKKAEILKSLLASKTTFNVSNTNLPELAYFRTLNQQLVARGGDSWINTSGNIILAKVLINGVLVNITSPNDFVKLEIPNFRLYISTHINSIKLNPWIEKYNCLDYLFTLEFMNTTVGSFVGHDNKTQSQNVLELEAGHFLALHKRNVSMTASMHEFQLNLLNGIPGSYNLAVIEDIHDKQGTISGLTHNIKPFDGATFVNPFVVLLENFSLGGAKVGITKKLFVHFKNETTGTGGIIKTAGFGLTNDWIRNSAFLYGIMKKMTNHVWLNEDGSIAHVDITKDYYGNRITAYDNIYFKKNGLYFRVVDLAYNGNNTYSYNLQKVTEKGDFIDYIKPENGGKFISKPIDTNFKLWEFFGGAWSMELKNGKLVPSNTSVKNVVTAMNNTKSEETNIEGKQIRTLEDLWLPLKMVDVHYLATAGAVKQGAANINSNSKYTDNQDFDIQKIHMYQAGIQLDKEHHADDADISLFTQVVSACAAKGYTFEAASQLYDALRSTSRLKTKDHIDAVYNLFNANTSLSKAALREVLVKSIVKVLSTSKSNNFAVKLAKELEELAREGKKIKYSDQLLPLSDNNIHAKVLSAITSYLTKTGIKLKLPGILSVLTPSYNVNKLYNGKKYEAYENPEEELKEILKLQVPVYSKSFKWHRGDEAFMGLKLLSVEPNSLIRQEDGLPMGTLNPHDGTLLLDLSFLREEYNQRAWLNTENSKPVEQNFDSFDKWINFVLLREAMHEQYEQNEGESNFDYKTRINEEALKRLNSSITDIELGREYLVTRIIQKETPVFNEFGEVIDVEKTLSTKTEPEEIKTPDDYYKLKTDIAKGSVVEVTENVINGRNLAGYNVRFKTDQGDFLLWDLDSAHCLFKLDELKKKWKNSEDNFSELLNLFETFYPHKINFNINSTNAESIRKGLELYCRRKLLQDLANLSEHEPNVLSQFLTLKESRQNTPEWYNRFANWVNVKLGLSNGDFIQLSNGNKVKVTSENYDQIEQYVLSLFENMTKVRINGSYHTIDKNSIKILPYEVIMPKVFATVYGLTEFDSLEEIEKDPEFFIKQYNRNQASKVAPNQYTIEFKRSNGNHLYVITKLLLVGSGLHKLEGILIEKEDGTIMRLDSMQLPMYEITEDTEIYTDDLGNEVIVSDDIGFYINNLHYDSINLSEKLEDNPELLKSIPKMCIDSSNKIANNYGKFLNGYKSILEANSDWNDIDEWSPLYKQLKAKHTSFLRSLDIVAARIPAQSMLSYMPMKVAAFDNPDINTAYVSTYQILLLGSK